VPSTGFQALPELDGRSLSLTMNGSENDLDSEMRSIASMSTIRAVNHAAATPVQEVLKAPVLHTGTIVSFLGSGDLKDSPIEYLSLERLPIEPGSLSEPSGGDVADDNGEDIQDGLPLAPTTAGEGSFAPQEVVILGVREAKFGIQRTDGFYLAKF
jgi:hypothetical protein